MKKTISLILTAAMLTASVLALSSCQFFGEKGPEDHTHTLGAWTVSVAATCDKDGTEKRVCTSAGCTYYETKSIKATGHNLVSEKGAEVSCINIGWDAFERCTKCDYTTYQEIPALGHDYYGNICRECGQEHLHTYGEWYGDTATCAEGGFRYKDCEGCDYTYAEPTSALAHDMDGGVCNKCGQVDYSNGDGDAVVLPPDVLED